MFSLVFFFFNDTATTEIYTLSLHDALPISGLDDLKHVAAAMALVRAHRNFGHLAAQLDPLGSAPPGDPSLDTERLGLTPEIMARIPAEVLRIYVPGRTLAKRCRTCARPTAVRSRTKSSTSAATRN